VENLTQKHQSQGQDIIPNQVRHLQPFEWRHQLTILQPTKTQQLQQPLLASERIRKIHNSKNTILESINQIKVLNVVA